MKPFAKDAVHVRQLAGLAQSTCEDLVTSSSPLPSRQQLWSKYDRE
jgi:hypothetical protein